MSTYSGISSQAEAAREGARQQNGQFGHQEAPEQPGGPSTLGGDPYLVDGIRIVPADDASVAADVFGPFYRQRLCIDVENGTVEVFEHHRDAQVSNVRMHHGFEHWYDVGAVSGAEYDKLMRDVAPLARTMSDAYDGARFDGSNMVATSTMPEDDWLDVEARIEALVEEHAGPYEEGEYQLSQCEKQADAFYDERIGGWERDNPGSPFEIEAVDDPGSYTLRAQVMHRDHPDWDGAEIGEEDDVRARMEAIQVELAEWLAERADD